MTRINISNLRVAFFILFFFGCPSVFAQDSLPRKISLTERASIEGRMVSYRSAVELADSMYTVYQAHPFVLITNDPVSLSDGLSWVRNLYIKTQTFRTNSKYCSKMIAEIDEKIRAESRLELDKQYQKLKNKAEEYYQAGNLTKAKELYMRCLTLRPSDESAMQRLFEIDKTLSKPSGN